MTCEHCQGADKLFDLKGAKKELKRYRKKGPRKSSAKLIRGIKEVKNGSTTLLEIGGGIGAVHVELIKDGIESVTNIDASTSYIELAKEESSRQNVREKVNYFEGDFLDHVKNISEHDIVILDKVICCYPHMTELLTESLSKSKDIFALVYPKSGFLGRMMIKLANMAFWFKRNPFRVFLHPNNVVRDIIEKSGYKRAYYQSVLPWNIEVYTRST